jgi:hypothetical protein
LGGVAASAPALGGRPGFFFSASSAATPAVADLTGFLVSSLAVAFSALAGDLVGTGLATFVADFRSLSTTFSLALAAGCDDAWTGLRSAGFAAVDGFADF